MMHAAGLPPNNPLEQTVGSPSLAATAQWARWADQ
jgi:hypothetical protein